MKQIRADEQFAFNVVGRVLGVEVEHFDTGGRQGAVDGILHYPDGHRAALEVSSIGPESEAKIMGALNDQRHRRDIPDLSRVWSVDVPNDYLPRDLPKVDAALLRCERDGFDSLDDALWDDESRALLTLGVSAFVVEVAGPVEPKAYVHVHGPGGWEGQGIEPLPDELAAHLDAREMQDNLAKLAASGIEERHLFLMVRPSAFSFPVYDSLSFGGSPPTRPPQLPAVLTEVWLASELIAGGVIRATADGQWLREPIEQADRVHARRRPREPRSS